MGLSSTSLLSLRRSVLRREGGEMDFLLYIWLDIGEIRERVVRNFNKGKLIVGYQEKIGVFKMLR